MERVRNGVPTGAVMSTAVGDRDNYCCYESRLFHRSLLSQ